MTIMIIMTIIIIAVNVVQINFSNCLVVYVICSLLVIILLWYCVAELIINVWKTHFKEDTIALVRGRMIHLTM